MAGDDWLNILPKIPLPKTKLRIKTEILKKKQLKTCGSLKKKDNKVKIFVT